MTGRNQDLSQVLQWLRAKGREREELFQRADEVRHEHMGDEVFVRGIIEFSNRCSNDCLYCGLRRSHETVRRYCMTVDEILDAARWIRAAGFGTVVLQSGEAPSAQGDREIEDLLTRIRIDTGLAITLSVGDRPRSVYARWRARGMDRYLLRFETSDADLFACLHPDCTLEERLRCIHDLKELGVQTGSGFMIGVPGETLEVLARNIVWCRELDLDMIGIGPFIPSPDTPLAGEHNAYADDPEMFYVALAALRLTCRDAHIPATTAFDAVFPGTGRDRALQRGANIFMPNCTPVQHRADYQLYPGKPAIDGNPKETAEDALRRLAALGRPIGLGPGHAKRLAPKG